MNPEFLPPKPFVGLRPFETTDSLIFFGRRDQTIELLQRLHETHFVAVLGPSGSGKSSLIRAGLIPKLMAGFLVKKRDQWHIAAMRPSNRPLSNLGLALLLSSIPSRKRPYVDADDNVVDFVNNIQSYGVDAVLNQLAPALENSDANLLLLVDQFEELFRYHHIYAEGGEEAEKFVSLILAVAKQRHLPIFVVITMRSDFLGDCIIFHGLPEAINKSIYLVPRLSAEQLREAIEVPIRLYGTTVTSRLLNELLSDVGYNPDQLPILQHVLMRIWNCSIRDKKEAVAIDIMHYEKIGGMKRALSNHAEEVLMSLDDRGKVIAKKLFQCLTEKEDNRVIRRPITLSNACSTAGATFEEVAAVVEMFRSENHSFLMPPSGVPISAETVIDISHESLIRNWRRLYKWVDEEAQSATMYRRIAETARLHREHKAALWRDPDLQLALDWREKTRPNKNWALRYHPEFRNAMEFLALSEQSRAFALERRHKTELLKRYRKLTMLLSILLMLAVNISLLLYLSVQVLRTE